jgi:hypothetical protein
MPVGLWIQSYKDNNFRMKVYQLSCKVFTPCCKTSPDLVDKQLKGRYRQLIFKQLDDVQTGREVLPQQSERFSPVQLQFPDPSALQIHQDQFSGYTTGWGQDDPGFMAEGIGVG